MSQHTGHSVLTYVTGNGQRANVTLPDGNTVALDVASRLEVPADYETGHHTLRVTGQGLITVQHHDGTPFTVVVGATTVHVLGTSFAVRHFPTDSVTTVAVHDGKVAIHSITLMAGRQLTIAQDGSTMVRSVDPGVFSFAMGVLTFNNVPLSAAIPELDRWYDVDVRLGDPALAVHRVAGDYSAGSLSDLTAILEGTFNVRVVRSGRTLTLFPR